METVVVYFRFLRSGWSGQKGHRRPFADQERACYANLLVSGLIERAGKKKKAGKKEQSKTHLFCAHEIRETYAAFWNDRQDDPAEVPTHVVDIERAVGLDALSQSTWTRLCQERCLT